MTSTIVNLTLLKVNEELENFLDMAQEPYYQSALNDVEFRQKLTAFILNRLPNRYLTVEPEKAEGLNSTRFIFTTQERLNIENLIHLGIYYLFQKHEHLASLPSLQGF
jgi:hypothetical protein